MQEILGQMAIAALRLTVRVAAWYTRHVPSQIPLVDYLVLGDSPHLVAHECTSCGARYFDRRNACASCGGTTFTTADVATEGEVRAFTIVSMAAPGIPVPFVARDHRLQGHERVRRMSSTARPIPSTSRLGMQVKLATYSLGTDAEGTEAIGFGFEPA